MGAWVWPFLATGDGRRRATGTRRYRYEARLRGLEMGDVGQGYGYAACLGGLEMGDVGQGYGYAACLGGLAIGDVGHDYGCVARLGGLRWRWLMLRLL
ncbi:MAG: hypothetical protein M3Z04_03450 [Chloroflexota bacterium]|nr:hypothetical protein [Chloroflexota bacterium]